MLCSAPFRLPSSTLTRDDLSVYLVNNELAPVEVYDATEVLLERVDGVGLSENWYRLTNLPDTDDVRKTLTVFLIPEVDVPVHVETFEAESYTIRHIATLLQPPALNVPVTLLIAEAGPIPIAGASVSIWQGTVPVIPMLISTSGGLVKVGLAPGTYEVYVTKPFYRFENLPMSITVPVLSTGEAWTKYGTYHPATLADFQRVTIYGRILRPDLSPLVGAAVRIRIANPGQTARDVGFTRSDVEVATDATGYFEANVIGGLEVIIDCPSTGYGRRGQLPRTGSYDWNSLFVAGESV